eukprot:COSAG06_NODE_4976_length_3815_cov_2.928149_4_plen_109_part_00
MTNDRLDLFYGNAADRKAVNSGNPIHTFFTVGTYAYALTPALVANHHINYKARRVSCGRPEAWHASRFSAHIASAPLCNLDPEMGSAPIWQNGVSQIGFNWGTERTTD